MRDLDAPAQFGNGLVRKPQKSAAKPLSMVGLRCINHPHAGDP